MVVWFVQEYMLNADSSNSDSSERRENSDRINKAGIPLQKRYFDDRNESSDISDSSDTSYLVTSRRKLNKRKKSS